MSSTENFFLPILSNPSTKERRKFANIVNALFLLINSRLDQLETIDHMTRPIEEKLDVVRIHAASRCPRCRMSKPGVLSTGAFLLWNENHEPGRSVVTSRRLMTPDYAAIFVHEDACVAARNWSMRLPIRESHSYR